MSLIMKNMQEIREKKGMRREDLASKSGMSYAAIRAIEMGIREPLVGNALKIASALNTTIEKLTK